MVAEHRAKDQLHIEHKNREQSQSDKSGSALVEFGARLLFDPAAAGKEGDRDGDTEEGLGDRSVRAGNGCGQKE